MARHSAVGVYLNRKGIGDLDGQREKHASVLSGSKDGSVPCTAIHDVVPRTRKLDT